MIECCVFFIWKMKIMRIVIKAIGRQDQDDFKNLSTKIIVKNKSFGLNRVTSVMIDWNTRTAGKAEVQVRDSREKGAHFMTSFVGHMISTSFGHIISYCCTYAHWLFGCVDTCRFICNLDFTDLPLCIMNTNFWLWVY